LEVWNAMSQISDELILEITERLGVYDLDDAARDFIRSLQPMVRTHARSLAEGYWRRAIERYPTVGAKMRPLKDDIIASELRHIDHLFAADFGRDYAESLHASTQFFIQTGIGSRFRIAMLMRLSRLAMNDIRRKHRFSGSKVAELSGHLLRLALFDLVTLAGMDRGLTDAAIERQRLALDAATTTFRGKIASAASGLKRSAAALGVAAGHTTENIALARSATIAGEKAATETADRASRTANAAAGMSASIQELSRSAQAGSATSEQARMQMDAIAGELMQLNDAMQTIGSIVTTIDTIAGQTNLLSLNATIEAARAGESGRGFAVVASEVKALAQQTSEATASIGSQLDQLRQAVLLCVNRAEEIRGTMTALDEGALAMRAAADEQTGLTQEMAGSAATSASAASAASARLQELAAVATRVEMATVEVSAAASDVEKQTTSIEAEVDGFLRAVAETSSAA
jgi:methyl-accepting chemotaxis protein